MWRRGLLLPRQCQCLGASLHCILIHPSPPSCTVPQVHTFGLFLCRLDIRQESVKHTAALDAITTYLGLGSYQ